MVCLAVVGVVLAVAARDWWVVVKGALYLLVLPIIFVAGPDDVPLIISGINEVKVRGARAIVIGEEDARLRANGDDLVIIPHSDQQINALLAVLPLQLLSYHMSVMRGFDPDFPRNLSKTLTVD